MTHMRCKESHPMHKKFEALCAYLEENQIRLESDQCIHMVDAVTCDTYAIRDIESQPRDIGGATCLPPGTEQYLSINRE